MLEAIEFAHQIGTKHFGRDVQLVPLHGGKVNEVFAASTPTGRAIIRFPRDVEDSANLEKEAWCLNAVRLSGFAMSEVIANGEHDGRAYIVLSYLEGVPYPPGGNEEVWIRFGQAAEEISATELSPEAPAGLFSRFGRDLASAWTQHVEYNINELDADDPLLAMGVYSSTQRSQLIDIFERLTEEVRGFGLMHGDLAPQNAVLGPSSIGIIDWGSAAAGPVPWGDLARIADEDPAFSIAAIAGFAAGFGVDFQAIATTLDSYRLLSAMDRVRWAIDRRPARTEKLRQAAAKIVSQISS